MKPTKIGVCLFRAVSIMISETDDNHAEDCKWLRNYLPLEYNSASDYLKGTEMEKPCQWGTDIKLWAFADATRCAIRVFCCDIEKIQHYFPGGKFFHSGKKVLNL